EGYFWRFTDPASGRAVLALNGVNRGPTGHWATLGVAAHPNRFLRTVAHPEGHASTDGLGAFAGTAFAATPVRLRVGLGPDARVDAEVPGPGTWRRRVVGGSRVFQAVPALNQYWHPWLLGGTARGTAVVGEDSWDLDGWAVYGEKNWG